MYISVDAISFFRLGVGISYDLRMRLHFSSDLNRQVFFLWSCRCLTKSVFQPKFNNMISTMETSSVVDPFHFDTDPDPILMITDQDPDPDPGRILTKNQSFEIS